MDFMESLELLYFYESIEKICLVGYDLPRLKPSVTLSPDPAPSISSPSAPRSRVRERRRPSGSPTKSCRLPDTPAGLSIQNAANGSTSPWDFPRDSDSGNLSSIFLRAKQGRRSGFFPGRPAPFLSALISSDFPNLFSSDLPECHRAGRGHIQGIHPMAHGNLHHIIAVRQGLPRQPVSLCAQHNGQTVRLLQTGIVNGYGAVGEGPWRPSGIPVFSESSFLPPARHSPPASGRR